jgi:tRNA-2-methylthio-N6-dimethylallyladenosine synthase
LPVKRDSAFSAWVSVSVGCNNTCTFCIVPQLRGIEKDRPASEIIQEVKALVSQGVIEITLLGQNVNAYGVDFGDRLAFSKLLRECGKIEGLERVRFMSPHPRDFTDDVIEAMAETKNVMPHLHMPLQSGSDKVLQAMRRSYRRDRYLGIIDKVRSAIPNAAITTDIIVGFPGESDADFEQTIDLVKQARFSAAYTFQYSKRPGTPAALMPDQIEQDVMADRYNRLHKIQQDISKQENEKLVGSTIELLVSGHEGRHDLDMNRMNGRSADFRLTHFDNSAKLARPGDLVEVKVEEAFANHIVAGQPIKVTKTIGAAAHSAWVEDNGDKKILLGIPTLASLKSL